MDLQTLVANVLATPAPVNLSEIVGTMAAYAAMDVDAPDLTVCAAFKQLDKTSKILARTAWVAIAPTDYDRLELAQAIWANKGCTDAEFKAYADNLGV